MNLLPKTEVDFSQAEYWNKFFKKRGAKEFEWYGEFPQLCALLQKYIKPQDSLLVVGCGNSALSLALYDFGYRKLTNIDISSVAITQMKSKAGNNRPEMVFEQMDALDMSYEKETFSVVLDKGTLDALMPRNTNEDIVRAVKLFSQVHKVLKLNGRYIIISLLQDHILSAILDYFMKPGWMIRILRCWDVEKQNITSRGSLTIPVFMVVCVKIKPTSALQPVLEVNVYIDGKSQRLTSKEEMMTVIREIQTTSFLFRESKGNIELTFFKKDEQNPRYTLYIADVAQDYRKLLKYAAFIVPHGRETEWMFATPEGRNCLRESSGFDRLVVVTFHRNQNYGSLSEVQDELRESVLRLAPPLLTLSSDAGNIPYLTLGDGVGRRVTVYAGTSRFSGDLLVEDVEIENDTFRRLIFMNNQAAVQSEVKLKKRLHKSEEDSIDWRHLASPHILFMSVAGTLGSSAGAEVAVAVIGVGGGSLCLLLRDLYARVAVTGVEIDPLVIEIGQKYFGLTIDNRLKIHIGDGVEFLLEKKRWDVIMIDVDNKDLGAAQGCPPPAFLEPSVLASVAESLGDRGVLVINVVSRLDSVHETLLKKLRNYFGLLCWYNLKEDVNRIVFATNAKNMSKAKWRQEIVKAAAALDPVVRQKLTIGDAPANLDHFMNRLAI